MIDYDSDYDGLVDEWLKVVLDKPVFEDAGGLRTRCTICGMTHSARPNRAGTMIATGRMHTDDCLIVRTRAALERMRDDG